MDELISSINSFNDDNFIKIKTMIDSGLITNISILDKVIDPNSINKTKENIQINELSIYSNEFEKINKLTKNDLHNILNEILPKECELPNKELEHQNMDDLINLIDDKIKLITDMIT